MSRWHSTTPTWPLTPHTRATIAYQLGRVARCQRPVLTLLLMLIFWRDPFNPAVLVMMDVLTPPEPPRPRTLDRLHHLRASADAASTKEETL